MIRLPRWQHHLLLLMTAVLVLTGGAWLSIHYSIGGGTDALPHPSELWMIRLHGAAAFGGLFTLGVLAAGHVPAGWRITGGGPHRRLHRGPQRYTGLAMLALASVLVLSGYALYYFTPEDWRPAMGWLHAIAGLTMTGLGLAHRRSHRRQTDRR
jgi:hypothetical protein